MKQPPIVRAGLDPAAARAAAGCSGGRRKSRRIVEALLVEKRLVFHTTRTFKKMMPNQSGQRPFIQLLAVLAVWIGLTSAVRAQLQNGDFEQPVVPTVPGYITFFAPSSGIPGWSVTGGSVDIVNNSYYPTYDGTQSLDLNGTSLGTIEQTFPSTIGAAYQFNFYYANNPFNGGTPSARVDIVGSGGTLFTQTFAHSSSTTINMDYQPLTVSFTADSASSTLRFTALTGNPAGGIVIDGVPSTIPEPATCVLAAIGSAALLFAAKRRSR